MKILTKFYSKVVFTTVTKAQLKRNLESLGYFNVRYSGYDRGFYADYYEGKQPIL